MTGKCSSLLMQHLCCASEPLAVTMCAACRQHSSAGAGTFTADLGAACLCVCWKATDFNTKLAPTCNLSLMTACHVRKSLQPHLCIGTHPAVRQCEVIPLVLGAGLLCQHRACHEAAGTGSGGDPDAGSSAVGGRNRHWQDYPGAAVG